MAKLHFSFDAKRFERDIKKELGRLAERERLLKERNDVNN